MSDSKTIGITGDSLGTVRLFQRQSPVGVLGPGRRAVIWVQGCPLACAGCIVPESWDGASGETVSARELAEWVLTQTGIEGVTFSGGEPMAQAGALVGMVDFIRERADIGVVCYTGYTFEALRRGTEAQKELLRRVDLLVDGPYVERLHANLLWRASSNQRLLLLTGRYRALLDGLAAGGDRSAGLEVHMDEDGAPSLIGVPPSPGVRAEFEASLLRRGVVLRPKGGRS